LDVVNARLTKIKYCCTCDIYRPPRAVHCGICNCCIERLDHHCPWLGTCVGKRNYKYFIVFITLLAVLVIKGVIITSIHIALNEFNFVEFDPVSGETTNSYSSSQVISIVILIVTAFLGIFVFWLLGYHQYLICRNETTNENLKGSYAKLGNPFDKGCKDNIMRLFRRDKRNWKPESQIAKIEKIELRGNVRKLNTARTLNRLSCNSNGGASVLDSMPSESKNNNKMMFS